MLFWDKKTLSYQGQMSRFDPTCNPLSLFSCMRGCVCAHVRESESTTDWASEVLKEYTCMWFKNGLPSHSCPKKAVSFSMCQAFEPQSAPQRMLWLLSLLHIATLKLKEGKRQNTSHKARESRGREGRGMYRQIDVLKILWLKLLYSCWYTNVIVLV